MGSRRWLTVLIPNQVCVWLRRVKTVNGRFDPTSLLGSIESVENDYQQQDPDFNSMVVRLYLHQGYITDALDYFCKNPNIDGHAGAWWSSSVGSSLK